MIVRRPAVAGSFYPGRSKPLARTVDQLLTGVAPYAPEPDPVGLVVPHAGYEYSGPVAASGYARVRNRRVSRVVVLGPAHFAVMQGMCVPAVEALESPLGSVSVDLAACRELLSVASVRVDDRPHEPEHSIEVQLPFLQRTLAGGWSLVPIAVGFAKPDQVADALDAVQADQPSTLPVVSTDLSHGLEHEAAVRRDCETVDAVLAGDPAAVGDHDACGAYPLRGLMVWARRHGFAFRLLDRRTSADTKGDPGRVVGYAALALDQ